MAATKTDPLSATFSALADPTRRAILIRLSDGPATVQELAGPFQLSLPAVSKHLKVLRQAGLLTQGRDGQRRPCHLEAQPLQNIAEWAERFRANWEESYSRLDELLARLSVTSPPDPQQPQASQPDQPQPDQPQPDQPQPGQGTHHE